MTLDEAREIAQWIEPDLLWATPQPNSYIEPEQAEDLRNEAARLMVDKRGLAEQYGRALFAYLKDERILEPPDGTTANAYCQCAQINLAPPAAREYAVLAVIRAERARATIDSAHRQA